MPASAADEAREPVAEPIAFAQPDITEREIEAVVQVMRSGWLTTGSKARELEIGFSATVEGVHAVALNSATAALHLAIEALGVGPGDLVFVPTYTFAASAEVVRYVGATPVLVDVDPTTSTIDPEALRARIETALARGEGRPSVVVPVHFAGVACDMHAIWNLARRYDLAVVEDAAHAFPASYRGRPVGWMPPDVRGAVCFSFYATKTMTTGEGGMLVTHDRGLADRARAMSLHGLSRQAWSRYAGGGWRYDILAPGFKYNMTDVAAAMGVVQLQRAVQMRDRRAQIASAYTASFAELDAYTAPTVPADRVSSWHLYPLRLAGPAKEDDRDALIERLRARGIATSVHFIPLHLHTYYRETYGYDAEDFPVALDTYRRVLSLPIWSAMSDAAVARVISEVHAATEQRG